MRTWVQVPGNYIKSQAHTYNPWAGEAETGRSLGLGD